MKRYLEQFGSSNFNPKEDQSRELSKDKEPEFKKEVNKKQKRTWIRKYDPDYMKYGFTMKSGTEAEPIPQCVICFECLSNGAMKPALLKRHLYSKHSSVKDKTLDFFKRKHSEFSSQKSIVKTFSSINTNYVRASYLASMHIAKCGKPHTIGETLLMPATKDIVASVFGDKAAKEIDKVSLSNNTVKRRIDEMASQVEDILIQRLKASQFYSLQLDESTDISNLAQLLVYIRFDFNNEIQEEILFCKPLTARTTSQEIFKIINDYFIKNHISWLKCVGVCTDGARSMIGKLSGVVTKIKEVAPECKSTHCIIHREALATKNIPVNLKKALDESVNMVNFIKSRALNSRLFSILCGEMGSAHATLLLHTEVRWLSRGKVLSRLFELRDEIYMFLTNSKYLNGDNLIDEQWLCRLAYLSDFFSRLNELNLSLQGVNNSVFDLYDKISAFERKLQLMQQQIEKQNVNMFPSLSNFIEENILSIKDDVMSDIRKHLTLTLECFQNYFREDLTAQNWIRNPFAFTTGVPDDVIAKESFIDLSSDGGLKLRFQSSNLFTFWLSIREEYPEVSCQAVKFLMPFATTYLREKGFSAMTAMKTKYRALLDIESNLRLKLTNIEPDITSLVNNKQAQPSH